MVSPTDFAAIAELDLEPIKIRLMHREAGEGWSLQKASAVEFEYRRFLYLMKIFPQCDAAPLFDVDIFWHYHILDTQKYALDCENVFGHFLHHVPGLGLCGANDELPPRSLGEKMRQLYEETFGEQYIRPFQIAVTHRQHAAAAPPAASFAAPTAASPVLPATASAGACRRQRADGAPATACTAEADPIQAIWSDARMIDAELAWSNFQGIDQPALAGSDVPRRRGEEGENSEDTCRRQAEARPTLANSEQQARFYAIRPRLTPSRA